MPPAGEAPTAPSGSPWSVIGGAVAVVVLVVIGVVLYNAVTGDDEDGSESALGDADKTEAAGATLTPIATVEPSPTTEQALPTERPPAALPTFTPQPPVAGHAAPEEAIAAFFADQGLGYAGDCNFVDLDRDVGSYCSSLWEDQFDTRIYTAGPAFSEPDTWMLVARLGAGDDWTLVDFAVLDPYAEDLGPPWP